jgi:hypothetical protein
MICLPLSHLNGTLSRGAKWLEDSSSVFSSPLLVFITQGVQNRKIFAMIHSCYQPFKVEGCVAYEDM